MQTADVVGVTVCRDGDEWAVAIPRRAGEVADPHAGIDQQIAIAAAHVPDVALPDGVEVGLPEQRDGVVDPLRLEPALSDAHSHGIPFRVGHRYSVHADGRVMRRPHHRHEITPVIGTMAGMPHSDC